MLQGCHWLPDSPKRAVTYGTRLPKPTLASSSGDKQPVKLLEERGEAGKQLRPRAPASLVPFLRDVRQQIGLFLGQDVNRSAWRNVPGGVAAESD